MFKNIVFNRQYGLYCNLQYIPNIKNCIRSYYKFLIDDFSKNCISDIYSFVESISPYFWVITDYDDTFMGFVFLDNFTGNENKLYSAELTTCFERGAWGVFTRFAAKIFLKKCFDELGLVKIKAQIYPDNFRVKTLLKSSGFTYETTLLNETLRLGKPQNIDIYAIYRDYYYK